jgi:phosphoribosyl 1,2-cyclic phosphodiesterase
LWAGHLQPDYRLEEVLGQLMQPPIFPLLVKDLKASLTFTDFPAGQSIHSHRLESAGIVMRTLPLLHPDRATAYRLQFKDKAVCYVTDVEHKVGELDAALVDFIRDADVFIYDSTYTDEEFATYKGWGHSTWQQAVRLARAADVKKLVTFHHDPQKTDAQLDGIASQLSALMPSAQLAREGLVIGV